jgi:methionine synthase I (cobalamin-dependent)
VAWVRELAEFVDQQVAVLGGAWGTMVHSKQLAAADYRRHGHHRDIAGHPDLLNLTRPDIVLRRSSQARFPEKAMTEHRSIVACNHEP